MNDPVLRCFRNESLIWLQVDRGKRLSIFEKINGCVSKGGGSNQCRMVGNPFGDIYTKSSPFEHLPSEFFTANG